MLTLIQRAVPFRLGFAVKVLGGGGLRVVDSRRWQSRPHLRHSLESLEAVFEYLGRIDVRVYRLSSRTIPYGSHAGLPEFDYRRQLDEVGDGVEALGRRARELGLRLSTHPGQYTVLNAREPAIVTAAIAEVDQHVALLDGLGQGPDAAVVVHVGGEYGARAEALDRWARTWERLSDRARARLALENDERTFSTFDVLKLHARTGVRVVLDVHHHRIHPASAFMPLGEALAAAFSTWPSGTRPKVHLSSARTMLVSPEAPQVPSRPAPSGARRRPRPAMAGGTPTMSFPALRSHADLVLPWDLEAVVTAARRPFDVMLEAKAKDLALLELRRTLGATRPDLAAAEERSSSAS